MIDENTTQIIKDFLQENSLDELQDYLLEKGYNFSNEEIKEALRPILKEIGMPENQIEKTIIDSFRN